MLRCPGDCQQHLQKPLHALATLLVLPHLMPQHQLHLQQSQGELLLLVLLLGWMRWPQQPQAQPLVQPHTASANVVAGQPLLLRE